MRRKITAVMLVVLMSISAFASALVCLPVAAATVKTSGDYQYELVGDGTEVEITRYTGAGGAVTIPGEINGMPVTAIKDFTFFAIINLTSVVIPANVTSLGPYPFFECYNLTSITVDASNPSYSSVSGVLYDKNVTSLIECPAAFSGSFSVPTTVTSIDDCAFSDCAGMNSIIIPDSVTSIGVNVFAYCTSLTSILLPSGLTSIGDYTFEYCTALSAVYLPDGLTSIGSYAFKDCTSLTSIVIPSSVTSLNDYTFQKCSALSEIVFNGNAPEVGTHWIIDCNSSLTVYYYSAMSGFTTPTWEGAACSELNTTSPMVSIISPSLKSYLRSSSITVTWAIYDPDSNVTKVEFRHDGGAWTTVTGTSQAISSLAEGTHMAQVRITYGSGSTTMVSSIFTVDTTSPSVTVSPSGDGVDIDTEITIAFSEKMNTTGTSITVQGTTGTLTWSGSVATYVPSSLSYNWEYRVIISGLDLAGNAVSKVTTFNTSKVGHINGILVDKNGNALSGATAVLNNGKRTTTGTDGHFSFTNLTAGMYILSIYKSGYGWKNVTATVEVNTTTDLGQLKISSDGGSSSSGPDLLPALIAVVIVVLAIIGLIYVRRSKKK